MRLRSARACAQTLLGALLSSCLKWLNTFGNYMQSHVKRIVAEQAAELQAIERRVDTFLRSSDSTEKNFAFVKVCASAAFAFSLMNRAR